MNLADAREALADALSAVPGYDVRPRPFPNAGKTGDGWVVVTSLRPSERDFAHYTAALTAVVVLSSDEATAEGNLDDDAVELLTALTECEAEEFDYADPLLETQTLITGSTATPLYVAVLTLTLEVD